MKKIFAYLLILALMLCSPISQVFASNEVDTVQESSVLSEKENSTDSIDHIDTTYDSFQTTAVKDFRINETSESFLQKITSDDWIPTGTVTDSNGNISSFNDYFVDKPISRFDLTELAYKNGVISEAEMIQTYCELIENQQFENQRCLCSITKTLTVFHSSNHVNPELNARITSITQPNLIEIPSSREAIILEDSSTATKQYPSTNFLIIYDSSIADSEAQAVASFMETTRNRFSALGYRQPLLDEGETRYQITLKEDDNGDPDRVTGNTQPITYYGIKASTQITIYKFEELSSEVEEVLVHEYFHAIQAAYNYNTWISSLWFDESTACWASLILQQSSNTFDFKVVDFLNNHLRLHDTDSYGSILFFLALQKETGVIGVVRRLWEQYATLTESGIVYTRLIEEVIDVVLDEYNTSFTEVFTKMAYYNFEPSTWYSNVHPQGSIGTSAWVYTDYTTQPTVPSRDSAFKPLHTQTQPLNNLSAKHVKFYPDVTTRDNTLTVQVTFTGAGANDCICQGYYKKADGTSGVVTLTPSSSNTYTLTTNQYGSTYQWYGIVLTNLSHTDNATFSVNYKVERGTEDSHLINYASGYYERTTTLAAGEYHDFRIYSVTAGNRVIQTFGTKDTYMQLYDNNGNLLASNDDFGYSNNALLSYNFSARTYYRIRVTFYSFSNSGDVKLSILTAPAVTTYEDFTTYSNRSTSISFNYIQYYTTPMVIKYTTTQDKALQLYTDMDAQFYIIDPRSTASSTRAFTTNPDSTKGLPCLYNIASASSSCQITKTFDANIPYLVIARPNNLSTINGESGAVSFSS